MRNKYSVKIRIERNRTTGTTYYSVVTKYKQAGHPAEIQTYSCQKIDEAIIKARKFIEETNYFLEKLDPLP